MFRNRLILKAFAILFLLEIVSSVVWPTISYALTSGPTVPEATNFEPVDTTDMVNLFTGDMVYNTPIIDVPGPNGGYPMSLSYHAGIDPNIESSWVGLGWSLNAGSISRLVNGFADDHKDVDVVDHFHWDNGTQTTYTVGVTVPVRGVASVTAGLSFTNNSNTGFSVTPFAEAGVQLSPSLGIQASSISGTANVTGPVTSLMGYVNMIENREMALSKRIGPLSMDVKISSKGVKPRLTVAGITKDVQREGKVNRIQNTSGTMIPIPTPIGIIALGVSRTYVRTWVNETATVKTNGSLYFPLTEPSSYTHMNARAFDTYDLNKQYPNVKDDNPEKRMDGSFADYDSYTVNAQGVSGSIRPYHYYNYLYRQNRNNDGSLVVRSVPMGATGNPVKFRFVNDFSNRFLFEPSSPGFYGPESNPTINPTMNMSFQTGDITAGLNGEGYTNNTLAGSKHIEFFTNNDIVNNFSATVAKRFVNCTATDFTRNATAAMADQVGGFKITNESGVTYHFSLPVYSFEEYTYTEKIRDDHDTYQEITRNGKYAYTWMLTAITGPDYVDRGGAGNAANGKIDAADYGYWVEFGYRKWTPDYIWRNPADGYEKDFDNNFQTYSHGKKEIYYLDYARTSTHIALFEKSTKRDGKSIGSTAGGFSNTSRTTARLDQVYLLDYSKFISLGGFSILNNFSSNKLNITDNSIRSVKFNYDYSLCPQTVNSFNLTTPSSKDGKLTLTSLKYLGKAGADMLPAVEFGYELENPFQATVEIEAGFFSSTASFDLNNSDFEIGDIIKFTYSGSTYNGLITDILSSGEHKFRLMNEFFSLSTLNGETVTLSQTKNPKFDENQFDMWKFYKSDYQSNDESRLTTPVSAKSVDVWSLRQIKTMLGADINFEYEADYYEEVVLSGQQGSNANHHALRIKNVQKLNENQLKVFFFDEGYKLSDLFQVNETLDLNIIGAYTAADLGTPIYDTSCDCPTMGFAWHEDFEGSGTIRNINDNTNSLTLDAAYFISSELEMPSVIVLNYNESCYGNGGEPRACTYNTQNWPTYIAAGVAFAVNKPFYGGGIRVKQIEIADDGVSRKTNYTYKHGLTTYEPVSIPKYELNPDYEEDIPSYHLEGDYQEGAILQSKAISKKYSDLFNVAREVPGPAVTYKEVIVEGSVETEAGIRQDETYQQFKFQTFEYNMVKHTGNNYNPSMIWPAPVSIAGVTVERHAEGIATLEDITAAIGNLKSSAVINYKGNTLQSTTYDYFHDAYLSSLGTATGYSNLKTQMASKYQSQGILIESFSDARIIRDGTLNPTETIIGITSKRRTYPSILTKVTHKNYKTGIESTNEIIAYDFFSGEDVKSISRDGYGNTYLSEILPAYKSYNSMGLAMAGGANMLTQVAGDYLFKVDPVNNSTKLALVSANIQKWSTSIPVLTIGSQPAIWRKDKSYAWVGHDSVSLTPEGFYPIANFIGFTSWSDGTIPPEQWQQIDKVRLYDIYSHALEAEDLNGNLASTKMSFDQTKVFAAVSNAAYREFAYSGAEETPVLDQFSNFSFGGGVYIEDFTPGISLSSDAHTGAKSLRATDGLGFFYSMVPVADRTYHVSVWSKSADAQLKYKLDSGPDVTPLLKVRQAGAWYLIECDIPLNGSYDRLSVWCADPTPTSLTLFDDFRIHPADASMVSYVYNEWGELSHILDANNLYIRYVYDSMGRLKETYRETLIKSNGQPTYGTNGVSKVNEVDYNHGRNN